MLFAIVGRLLRGYAFGAGTTSLVATRPPPRLGREAVGPKAGKRRLASLAMADAGAGMSAKARKRPAEAGGTPERQAPRAKKQASPRTPRSPPPSATPPVGWEETYGFIRELRAVRDAAVDTMGCERLADTEASKADQDFQTLVSLMLSSQTKDEVNAAAMAKLRAHGCTPSNIADTPPDALNGLIRSVGFHNNKTKYLLSASQRIRDEFEGHVPTDLDTLLTFDGVGPKMAIIYLNVTRPDGSDAVGIGVDTHVHRISQQLGWVPENKNPEITRRHLEAWMPKDLWGEVNVLMVGLGQQVQASGGSIVAERALKLAVARKGAADEALKPVSLALTLGVKPASIADAFEAAPASLRGRPGVAERLAELGVKLA